MSSSTSRVMNPSELDETASAKSLHVALRAVDITTIEVLSMDRLMPRKDQAKLARSLFRKLGLRGISVTVPSYSMARTVAVALPRRQDHELSGGFIVAECEAARANVEAGNRILSILLAAFPNHEDRSDSRSDYSDSRWSVT